MRLKDKIAPKKTFIKKSTGWSAHQYRQEL